MTTTETKTVTEKPLTLIVSIKDVIFRTNGLGKMFPLISFNETKDLEKIGVDAMMYGSVKQLGDGVSKGARLKVDFDKTTFAPTINTVIKPGTQPILLPKTCPSCLHDYMLSNDENYCSNYICSARDRGFLYKMFKLAVPTVSWEMLNAFFNGYPVGTTAESIASFSEYNYLTKDFKGFNTKPRVDIWVKHHGEKLGEELFALENKMLDFFKQEEIPKVWFWHICNFPLITEKVFYEMAQLDPQELVDGENKEEYLALSTKARRYLDHNLDMVIFLLKFFNNYGKKSWIDLENRLGLSTIASSGN